MRARKLLKVIVKKWGETARTRLLHGVLTLWVHFAHQTKETDHFALLEKTEVGFPLFFCDFNRKMQKLPLVSCILMRK